MTSTDNITAPARVHRLFEEHAGRRPEATAVICGSTSLRYGELDHAATRVARFLRHSGLKPGQLVMVAMDRTVDAVVAMLGVLKAGGTYVPVEPSSPDATLRYVLADTSPFAILTHERHRVRLGITTEAAAGPGPRIVCLDGDGIPDVEANVFPPAALGVPPACVLYTSGTTGAPAGVLIGHDNLTAAFRAWQKVYDLDEDDRHLQLASIEFDVFTADWVRALGSGAVLVLNDGNVMHDTDSDIAELHQVIIDAGITVVECNVATLSALFEYIRSAGLDLGAVRLLVVGTDTWYLDEHLAVQEYLGPGVRHLNTYGLVEATVDSAYFELSQLDVVPGPEAATMSLIGKPFPGTRIHILAPDGTPCPVGEPGEICVAGDGVAHGYWNSPRPRSQRFQSVAADIDVGRRLFRTGDWGRIRSDGLIEFLVRGVSAAAPPGPARSGLTEVDLAAVEATLRAHPDVREAAVVAEGSGSVAYVVPSGNGAVNVARLAGYLSELVARAHRPEMFVTVDSLPRTRAGKVDRTRLPRPVATDETASLGVEPSVAVTMSTFAAAKSAFGSGGSTGPGRPPTLAHWAIVTLVFAGFGLLAAMFAFPTAMDLTGIPQPWAALFGVLYAVEALSFGLGAAVLFYGSRYVTSSPRPGPLARAAQLATVWLLVAWLPQDNLYRLAAKNDWPRQALLVYAFNITLMAAGAVVAAYVLRTLAATRRTP